MKKLPPSKKFSNYSEEELYIKARKKVEKIKGFYIHLASYVIINIFILGIIYANLNPGQSLSFAHFSTAFFWGIGLLFHALGVFGKDMIFSSEWEARKIEEYMEREKHRSSGWE